MKKIIITTLCSIAGFFLLSCDDRSGFLSTINTSPQLYFNGITTKSSISDSVKTSLKHSSGPYSFKVNFFDKESNLRDVKINFVSGSGKLSQDGTDLQVALNTSADFANVVFQPTTPGTVRIDFTATDDFDASTSISLTLLVYDNLIPIASFTENKLGVNSPYEYELDATKSKDQDANKGGAIQAYHYTINGLNDIWTSNQKARIVFSGIGGQEVKLEVIDNDGGKSTVFTKVINVTN